MKNKSDAFEKLSIFLKEVENTFDKKVKSCRTNRGKEYDTLGLINYIQSLVVVHETIAPYSPSSNGLVERKNRTLINLTNAILVSSGAPKYFWGEAILIANFVFIKILF